MSERDHQRVEEVERQRGYGEGFRKGEDVEDQSTAGAGYKEGSPIADQQDHETDLVVDMEDERLPNAGASVVADDLPEDVDPLRLRDLAVDQRQLDDAVVLRRSLRRGDRGNRDSNGEGTRRTDRLLRPHEVCPPGESLSSGLSKVHPDPLENRPRRALPAAAYSELADGEDPGHRFAHTAIPLSRECAGAPC